MYQQQGGPPMYGMYGYDPRMGEPGQAARFRPERDTAPVKFTEGKLFIGGVETDIISKDQLVEYCSQWGPVADAVVMDRKGYGFVTFADPKDAMTFLEKRVHELKGRRLDAKAAVPKAHLGTAKLTKKMFVGGTGELTDQDFQEHFSQYGDIEDAAVVRREGQSRGFGFVTFKDEISVEKCLLVNHFIKGKKVELKRAVPKQEEAIAAQGMPPVFGYPAGPYSPQPGMMQQQFYPMPYGPGPGPYGLRPGFPPGAGHMAIGGDPYGWYGMGYMPYYPGGGYMPAPYGMLPQPGMSPYGGMHPHGYMAGPGMPHGPQQHAGAGSSAGHEQASSSGRGARAGNSRGSAGSNTEGVGSRQQQQQAGAQAASPAGPSSSTGASPGIGAPGVRRVASDPAAGSSQGSSSQQPPGLPAAASSSRSSATGASGRPGPRGPVVTTFPNVGIQPAGGPVVQRAMGPGMMQFAAAGVPPPGVGLVGALPAGLMPRSPVAPSQQQQQPAPGNRGPQQQQ